MASNGGKASQPVEATPRPRTRDRSRKTIPGLDASRSRDATPLRWAAETDRKETTMSNEQAGPETKGVTVKLLAALDLGPEIKGMAGRQLRIQRRKANKG